MYKRQEEETIYVANGLEHGRRLAAQGFRTSLLAGGLKSKMEAVVGLGAVPSLQKYNLNKASFGTNSITVDSGFTTPDISEAYIKVEVMKHAQKCYVLADSGKFGACTSVTTTDISDVTITTGKDVGEEYLRKTDIIEIEE